MRREDETRRQDERTRSDARYQTSKIKGRTQQVENGHESHTLTHTIFYLPFPSSYIYSTYTAPIHPSIHPTHCTSKKIFIKKKEETKREGKESRKKIGYCILLLYRIVSIRPMWRRSATLVSFLRLYVNKATLHTQ